MPGQYEQQLRPGKALTTGDQIANGAIDLRHLSAALFSAIQQISLHNHSGVKSIQIALQNLTGSFTQDGFLMRSPNGSLWRIRVDNSGTISATAA